MKTEKIHDTKLDIMDTAERLFAENGFDATSLRAITAAAGVNLGAVNYHFVSKEALILAVLKRRLKPMNDRRLELLEKFQGESGGVPVSVEKILEALFRPPLELMMNPEEGGHFFKLISQLLSGPGMCLKPLIKEEFAESKRRFIAALREALPGLSEDDAYWRMHFAMGSFVHTVSHGQVLEILSQGKCQVGGIEDTLERLIAFCAAGFASAELQSPQSL